MKEDKRNLERVYSECFERKRYDMMWNIIRPKPGKNEIFCISSTASCTRR
jgi:hypothetical protein